MSRSGMAVKSKRQQAILALVARERLASQEEIRMRLARAGLEATQSTISRDVEELGLARVHDASGLRYVVPGQQPAPAPMAMLRHALQEFAMGFTRGAGELLLVRTPSGAAAALGEALDRANLREIAGTVAGDNTVLVVPAEGTRARSVQKVLTTIMEA